MEAPKHCICFFLLTTIISILGSPLPPDQEGQVCISQGGRFPRFTFEGQAPRKASKGKNDLTLCRIYRKKTCCTVAQTHPALISIRKLASDGEGSGECLAFWEVMECSICDPRVGVNPGPPVLCISFCNSALEACQDAFFSFDTVNQQVLMPCGPKDTICARGREWASNGSEFCQLAGFAIPGLNAIGQEFCFDGKAEFDVSETSNQGFSKTDSYKKSKNFPFLHWVQQWVRRMDVGEKILWAVGGLVLTAGVSLMRRRGLSSQRRKVAKLRAVQEVRLKQQAAMHAATTQSSKKIGKRS